MPVDVPPAPCNKQPSKNEPAACHVLKLNRALAIREFRFAGQHQRVSVVLPRIERRLSRRGRSTAPGQHKQPEDEQDSHCSVFVSPVGGLSDVTWFVMVPHACSLLNHAHVVCRGRRSSRYRSTNSYSYGICRANVAIPVKSYSGKCNRINCCNHPCCCTCNCNCG